MPEKNRTTIECRFSAALSSLSKGEAQAIQFKTEYVLKSGSTILQMARDLGSESAVLNTEQFKQAVHKLLCEFARHVEDQSGW